MINHKKKRPKNLNLFTIRLPINAVVSILHRVSGLALFGLLPVMLFALQYSLQSAENYARLANLTDFWLVKLLLIGLSYPFFHHFYAGLRHLGQDVHWNTSLEKARFSSRFILILGAVSVLIFGLLIW